MQWKLANYSSSINRSLILTPARILGAEALCRWVSAERGIISPLKFITIAEDIGFINELGYQIIKTAMGEFRHFSQRASLKGFLTAY